METAIDLLSWIFLVAGSFFAVVGGVGLLRLPDFFSRMHGGGMTDTMGAGLILTGLMFQTGLSLVTFKLVLITLLLAQHGVIALIAVLERPAPGVVDAHGIVGGDGPV